jgi:DeoD family purine-nucleoside phosphorylase
VCDGMRSPAPTNASGVGDGTGGAGGGTNTPDWSRPPRLTAGTNGGGGGTCVLAADPVAGVFVFAAVPVDELLGELLLEDGVVEGRVGVGVEGVDGTDCGGLAGSTGVVLVGGFGMGLMSARAPAGSARANSTTKSNANGRNLISAMIRYLRPPRKGRWLQPPVRLESRVMPIHLRGEPGDYAEAVLLPGDPLRARHIAETFFDNPREVNSERGMLGYTGTFEGTPISVQSSGMGCPSAAIVVEELVQLGVKRIVRVGTCGGLQSDMTLGDLVLAISAVPSDGTMLTYTGGEPHAPTADFELVHAAVHQARHDGTKIRVGPCVSSSTFYDPDTGRAQRWSDRGVLAVEMEAAILFTVAAIRRIQAACLLTVSDIIVKGEFVRISDDELRAAVERMTELAIRTALSKAKD